MNMKKRKRIKDDSKRTIVISNKCRVKSRTYTRYTNQCNYCSNDQTYWTCSSRKHRNVVHILEK